MSRHSHHTESHYTERAGWLRAAVLGANDGIISVTSLVVGMAASGASTHTLLVSCVAGLISGSVSMAAGEYISVRSQKDIEEADLTMEAKALDHYPELELEELTNIYIYRGLAPDLAHQVALQLTAHDALQAHARDEIGIHEETSAQPLVAALASAVSFALGAIFPLGAIWLLPTHNIQYSIVVVGILALGIMGAAASYAGGSRLIQGAVRVMLWGIAAMCFSFWIGSLFNTTV